MQIALKVQKWVIATIALFVLFSTVGITIHKNPHNQQSQWSFFLKEKPTLQMFYFGK